MEDDAASSVAASLPLEILHEIYQYRLNRLLQLTPGSLARGQAHFSSVCTSWRRAVCAVGTVYHVEDFAALLRLSGVFSDRDPATKGMSLAMASSMKSLHVKQRHPDRRPIYAFGPISRILESAATSLKTLIFHLALSSEDRKLSKLNNENDRSDWKDVFAKLVGLSKLERLQIADAVFEADDVLGLLRSCGHLKSLSFRDHRNAICAPEEEDQLELLSNPTFILHHQLHTFDFNITSSVDALLVSKILSTGASITRLRINHDWESPFTLELATALATVAPQLQEFHLNFPTDVDHSLEFLMPLLVKCDSLHIDRPNIVFLPTIDVLPSLQHISIDSMGAQSIDDELAEMRAFLMSRNAEIFTVHLASSEDDMSLAIARFLNRCETAGYAVTVFDPPEW